MHYDKLKALVVDDVDTVRRVLKKTLGELNITQVEEAPSVELAWDRLNNDKKSDKPFDIVFCDWNMPMADGNELLKKVRDSEDRAINLLKFVMITSSDHKVAESMDLGAHNIIHKPFEKKFIKFKLDLIYKSFERCS